MSKKRPPSGHRKKKKGVSQIRSSAALYLSLVVLMPFTQMEMWLSEKMMGRSYDVGPPCVPLTSLNTYPLERDLGAVVLASYAL
jgi:hypothetical protein